VAQAAALAMTSGVRPAHLDAVVLLQCARVVSPVGALPCLWAALRQGLVLNHFMGLARLSVGSSPGRFPVTMDHP
jgi:hypothetical protein